MFPQLNIFGFISLIFLIFFTKLDIIESSFLIVIYLLLLVLFGDQFRQRDDFINPIIIDNAKKCMSFIINMDDKTMSNFIYMFDYYMYDSTNDYKLNDLYDLIPSVNIYNQSSHKNSLIYIDAHDKINYLDILDVRLGGGSYGIINEAVYNGQSVACKYFQTENIDSSKIKSIILSLFKENIIHMLLCCFKENINDCFDGYYINCIPEIYSMMKCHSSYIDDNENGEMLLTLIEKLDCNLAHFFSISNGDDKTEFTIILLIVYNLLSLQSTIDFMHKDLHVGNVMVSKLPKTETVKILFDGNVHSITTEYKTFIIDFGMASINLNKCNDIGVGDNCKINLRGVYESPYDKINSCHDLRILFSHLRDRVKSTKLQTYISNKMLKYESKIDPNIPYFHNFYNTVIDDYDKDFDTKVVLSDLLKCVVNDKYDI